MLIRLFHSIAYVMVILISSVGAQAWMTVPATLTDLTRSAMYIVRGRCLAAEVGMAEVAGARIPVTTYTFSVSEYLKGAGTNTITFRQVGTPESQPRDLGRMAGMPIYVRGTEYVLFLLPESNAGLTSPAGAGQGAFIVSHDGTLAPANRASGIRGLLPGVKAMSYESLRQAVLKEVGR